MPASVSGGRLSVSGSCGYGVRSAVTSRAWRIWLLLWAPTRRRQDASKFGQAFSEQSRPIGWTLSRSALGRACGTLASTCGAKPGRTVRAAATSAAIAIAESALIMTVPCPTGLCGSLVDELITKGRFGIPSRSGKNGFIRSHLFRGGGPDETFGRVLGEPVRLAGAGGAG